jgi:DNA-binding CsgD family transcriptional regulator
VASVARLGVVDLDRALGLVIEAARHRGDQPFDSPTAVRLLELVPADRAGYFEYAFRGVGRCEQVTNLYAAEEPAFDFGWTEEVKSLAVDHWPLHDPRWWGTRTAVTLSDCLSRRHQLSNPWCQQVMRPRSIKHEVKVWLPSPRGVIRGLFLVRGPDWPDFGHRDRAVLTVLAPHLARIREAWERRRKPPGLTPREAEVLRLVRAGLSNKEIAGRLVVSTGTVRTHLDNIFEKLGVHSRTAAIAAVYEQE